MSKQEEPSMKLDKLFKLDFYKKQERWNLKRVSSTQKTSKSSPNQDNIIETPKIKVGKTVHFAEDIFAPAASSLTFEVQELASITYEVQSPIAKVAPVTGSVTNRLRTLVSLCNDSELQINNSEAADSEFNWAVIPLHSQEDLNTTKLKDEIEFTSYEVDEPNDFQEKREESNLYVGSDVPSVTFDNWAWMNNDTTSTDYSNYYDWNLINLPHDDFEESMDNSFVTFMRNVHDAPHSSNLELDFYDGPESMDSNRLAELSPRQLAVGLQKYRKALYKLNEETMLRKMNWMMRKVNNISSASGEDVILASSF